MIYGYDKTYIWSANTGKFINALPLSSEYSHPKGIDINSSKNLVYFEFYDNLKDTICAYNILTDRIEKKIGCENRPSALGVNYNNTFKAIRLFLL